MWHKRMLLSLQSVFTDVVVTFVFTPPLFPTPANLKVTHTYILKGKQKLFDIAMMFDSKYMSRYFLSTTANFEAC